MPDFVVEYFYDSEAEHKWVVHVYLAGDFRFAVSGTDWESLMEDLIHAARINLDEELSVTW